MIPKNIFFYWDGKLPDEVENNINNYKNKNPEFNVKLLSNDDINKYKEKYSKLVKFFNLATISAFKSDIIRLIYLYEEGGIWIDCNTTLINDNSIKDMFEIYKDYDFVLTILSNTQYKFDLGAMVLISKPNARIVYESIISMTVNISKHFNIEKNNKEYVSYNYFLFIVPVVTCKILDYKIDDHLFRNSLITKFIKDSNNNITSIDLPKFKEYNCGIWFPNPNQLRLYGCNMHHHHGKNMHKHWSELQKRQKLFNI